MVIFRFYRLIVKFSSKTKLDTFITRNYRIESNYSIAERDNVFARIIGVYLI